MQELSHLSDAYSSLKTASAKFVACREAVDAINSSNKGAYPLPGAAADGAQTRRC